MKLLVKTCQTKSGTKAWCPELPGCQVIALNEKDAITNIEIAVQCYLASMNVPVDHFAGISLDGISEK